MKFPTIFGPARKIHDRLQAKILRPDFAATGPHKFLFYGEPGCGKTTCADKAALTIDPKGFATIRVNGKELNVETVRSWRKIVRTMPLGSTHYVTIIDEIEVASKDAQDLMLSWLDWMPAFAVVLATSNLDLENLSERLQTRMQQIKFERPDDQDIFEALVAGGIPKLEAKRIAEGAAGNCRAAELDATTYLDFSAPTERPATAV